MRVFVPLLLLPLAAAAQPAPGSLALPFAEACVTSPFGARDGAGRRASTFHQGVDLRAPAGTWVRAVAAGRVTAVRRIGGTGLSVDVTLPDGTITRFAHLGQVAPALANGKREVAAGDPLGRVGRTGISYGAHLHFELVVRGERIDPAPVLGVGPC